MKKLSALALLLAFIVPSAFALGEGPDAERKAHRAEMAKIKQAQRESRESSSSPSSTPSGKSTFWSREAERSGLNRLSTKGAGTFISRLNPVPFFKEQRKRYDERKAAAAK